MSDVPEPASIEKNEHGKVVKKECPHCGEMWSKRGYNSHARFCTEKGTGGGENTDPKGGENVSNSGETDAETLRVKPECPDCGAAVHDADDAAKLYSANGYKDQAQTIRAHDHYCDQCHTAFHDSEVKQ